MFACVGAPGGDGQQRDGRTCPHTVQTDVHNALQERAPQIGAVRVCGARVAFDGEADTSTRYSCMLQRTPPPHQAHFFVSSNFTNTARCTNSLVSLCLTCGTRLLALGEHTARPARHLPYRSRQPQPLDSVNPLVHLRLAFR